MRGGIVEPKGVRGALRACVAIMFVVSASWTRLGAQQVVNLPGSDKALPANLDDVFTVGTFDGAEWETFGDISGVSFDETGNLYIFDSQNVQIIEVDKEGHFVRAVGKKGEGPGELRSPTSFTVLRDGTIVVADMGHRAYVLYGPDGAYRRMVSFGGDPNNVSMGQIYADPKGTGVLTGGGNLSFSMSMGPGGPPAPPTTRPIDHIGLSGADATKTTVVEAWKPPVGDDKPREISGGGASFRMTSGGPRTFEPGLYVGPLPDGGVVYADTSTYAIKVADARGSLQRIIERPFEPKPMTEAMQNAEKKRRLDQLEVGEGPKVRMMVSGGGGASRPLDPAAVKEMMKGRLEQMQFYPELPVIMNLSTGWNGKIWVTRRGAHPTDVGPVDVLTPLGQYVGTFATGTLPFSENLGTRSTLVAFGPDGLVAHVEKGELDVPTVVVQRLPAVLR